MGRGGQGEVLKGQAQSDHLDPASFEQEFPGLSESANACIRSLVGTAEEFLDMADEALRHHKISRAGRQALAVLDGADEPLTPSVIADRLIVTTASVTSLLDTLEKRGLVVRRRDAADRRRVLVELTGDGRATVTRFLPEMMALQTAVMSGLSEKDRRQLLALVEAVRRGLDKVDIEATLSNAPPRGVVR